MNVQQMIDAGVTGYEGYSATDTAGGETLLYKKGTTHASIIGKDKIYSCGDGRVVSYIDGHLHIWKGDEPKYRIISGGIVCNLAGDKDTCESLLDYINLSFQNWDGSDRMQRIQEASTEHPDRWREAGNDRVRRFFFYWWRARPYLVDVMFLGLDDVGDETIFHRQADGFKKIKGENKFAVTKGGNISDPHDVGRLQAHEHIERILSSGHNFSDSDYRRILHEAITISSLYDDTTGGLLQAFQLGVSSEGKFEKLQVSENRHILHNLLVCFDAINSGRHLENCLICVSEGYRYNSQNEFTFISYIDKIFGRSKSLVLGVKIGGVDEAVNDDNADEYESDAYEDARVSDEYEGGEFEDEYEEDEDEGEDGGHDEAVHVTVRLLRFENAAQIEKALDGLRPYGSGDIRKAKLTFSPSDGGPVSIIDMTVYQPTEVNFTSIFEKWEPFDI